jgi:hypothetical protein
LRHACRLVNLVTALACLRASVVFAQQAPPTPIGPGSRTVLVHVEGDSPVELEAISGQTGRWATVCSTPCDAPLPLGPEYRVAGPGVRPSPSFELGASPGRRVVLRVSTGSKAAYAGGIALAAVGTAALFAGTLVLVFGAGGDQVDVDVAAGGALAGAGLAVFLAGLVLVFRNKESRATQVLAGLLPTAPRLESSLGSPAIWTEASADRAARPRTTTLPVFFTRF